MNIWVLSKKARKIAADLQIKFSGLPNNENQNLILDDFQNHKNFHKSMNLIVHLDEDQNITWIQIGIYKVGISSQLEGLSVPQ